MTKYQARQKAHSIWGGPDRYGCVVLRQKKHPKRYQVGWQFTVRGFAAPTPWTMMGAGDSWEEAFAAALAKGGGGHDVETHVALDEADVTEQAHRIPPATPGATPSQGGGK